MTALTAVASIMPAHASRTEITYALRGQSLQLPDFEQIYHDWPVSVSPHMDWLKCQVDNRIRWLLSQVPSSGVKDQRRKQKGLEGIDVGYLVSSWWPEAAPEVLCTLAYCALWLFMWDDEIDGMNANLGSDLEAAQQYRDDTLRYVFEELGLATVDSAPTNMLITSFSDIAVPLSVKDIKQRERFYEEIEYWIEATEVEQVRRSEPSLPSLHEYMEVRMGTSGVRVLCILYDILTGPTLDSCQYMFSSGDLEVTIAEDLELLTDLTNVFISVTNDVLSVKKELAVGAPDSTIPILWLESRDLTAAVDKVVRMLKTSRSLFDETEQRLLGICRMHGGNLFVERYIAAMKSMNSGNVAWSMRCRRYGLDTLSTGKGHIIVL